MQQRQQATAFAHGPDPGPAATASQPGGVRTHAGNPLLAWQGPRPAAPAPGQPPVYAGMTFPPPTAANRQPVFAYGGAGLAPRPASAATTAPGHKFLVAAQAPALTPGTMALASAAAAAAVAQPTRLPAKPDMAGLQAQPWSAAGAVLQSHASIATQVAWSAPAATHSAALALAAPPLIVAATHSAPATTHSGAVTLAAPPLIVVAAPNTMAPAARAALQRYNASTGAAHAGSSLPFADTCCWPPPKIYVPGGMIHPQACPSLSAPTTSAQAAPTS